MNGRKRRCGEADVAGRTLREGCAAKEKRNPFRFEEAEVVFLWKRLGNRFSFLRDDGTDATSGTNGTLPNLQTSKHPNAQTAKRPVPFLI